MSEKQEIATPRTDKAYNAATKGPNWYYACVEVADAARTLERELAQERQRREQAEASLTKAQEEAAGMREALERISKSTPDDCEGSGLGECEEVCMRVHDLAETAKKALSSDCGADMIPRAKLDELAVALKGIRTRYVGQNDSGHRVFLGDSLDILDKALAAYTTYTKEAQ